MVFVDRIVAKAVAKVDKPEQAERRTRKQKSEPETSPEPKE